MKIMVNEDRTVFVRIYDDGTVEIATRPEPDAIWGPPIRVVEET